MLTIFKDFLAVLTSTIERVLFMKFILIVIVLFVALYFLTWAYFIVSRNI